MVHHRLVSGIPESLAPLPHSPAPPCTPFFDGRQRAAPHSSSFPPTTTPLHTLHLDIRGPSPVLGPRQERYFLIVVDNYSRYTTVFPLRRKADVPTVLEPWLLARGGAQGLCGLRLHSDRGAGDYHVWGCLAHVRAPGANMLSARTRACVFLGFPLHASGWVFYDPVTHHFFASQDVTFDKLVSYYRSRPHRGSEAFSPPLFLTLEHPLVVPIAPPSSRPAMSGVSHVTPQSSPPQRLFLVVSGGAGGAVAEVEGTGAVGACGDSSRGAGGVRVETTPEEDTALSTKRPRPASPPGFSSVPQFSPSSPPQSVAAEPEGVPAGGTGVPGGVVDGGSGSRGAGAGDTSTATPTPRTVRFLTRVQRLERGVTAVAATPAAAAVAAAAPAAAAAAALSVEASGESRGGVASAAGWTRRSPLSRAVSPEPRRSRYRADGPFHLVLRSRVPSPPVLPQPPELSFTVLYDPLSDYHRASRLDVSHVLSALVTHQSAPLSSVSALVTTLSGFVSSHRLDYAAHLVSGPSRSPSSWGAPVFPLEVVEDRQFELGFLAAAVPHLCAMLLAPEGDPDALDIRIPRTHAEAVSGPWTSYWIAAEEAEMASYRSTGTYVDAVPPPGANVVNGMWLYKVKRPPGAPPVFKACYVARGFSQREGVDFFQTFAPTLKMTTLWWQLRQQVYGLRQAPREWHDTLRTTLAALDFFPSSADTSLFVRRSSTLFFVLVYVDDLVFATPDRRALASMKEELQRRHTCTDLGELQRYLGLQIARDKTARTITLTQSHMVEQILTRFRFTLSKIQPTPVAVDHGLTVPPSDKPFESSSSYPKLVGCLMYLMTCTRPDLAYPLSVLARFVAPGRHRPSHWYAAKRVANYEAEVYAAAMAAQELRWLSFLLTDLAGAVGAGGAGGGGTGAAGAGGGGGIGAAGAGGAGVASAEGTGATGVGGARAAGAGGAGAAGAGGAGAGGAGGTGPAGAGGAGAEGAGGTGAAGAGGTGPTGAKGNGAGGTGAGVNGSCCWPRPHLGGANLGVGSYAAVSMVGAVGDEGVVDTLEARLKDARRRHEANEYGPNLPLAVIEDEAMQEAERPSELLAQANYVAPVKQGGRLGQRGQSGGGGSSGWKPTKDADKKKSAKDSGRGGGSRRRERWLCGDPDHLSFECLDRSDSDDDDANGGRGRSWPVTKSTPDRLHASLAHVGMNTIRSSAKHEVATGLDLNSAFGADLPCVSCVGGKLAQHTFPDQGSDADDVLAVVHVDQCRPFRVAVKDGGLYFLLLKDRKTRYVWVRPVAKKSDALQEFVQWLAVTERQTKKMVLMLCSDRGGEFLGKQARDENGGGVGANDAAAHKCAASLVAPRSAAGHLGPQLPGAVDAAAGDDAIPAADWEDARLVAGTCMGLHGAVHGPRATAWWKAEAEGQATAGQQPTGEQAAVKPTTKPPATRQLAEEPTTGEKSTGKPAEVQQDDEGSEAGDDGGDAEESTDSDVVEVQRGPRQSGRIWRPPDFYVLAAFTTAYDEVDDDLQYDDAEEDKDFPELNSDMHADPKHRWDISMMTVKQELASWKGKAVKAAMDEEIRSLVGMGTWKLVEHPLEVNIMKNLWVLTTKYHIDDTVEREKARLVVKGFTQVYGADYDETYALVSSYVTLRIFLGIIAVLYLNLMQLDMKNAFLQCKLDRVLYMALDGVLLGAGWKKSQVNTALYFKVGDDKVTCWVLVYVDDLLACNSSAAMLKELKELLEAAFELRKISPVQKYLGLEIVHDRSVRKLWLHQQGYDDKLRRRFLDEEQNGRTPKTPVSVNTYATLTFDDEEAQERQEEEYWQK
ncbi:unnamed protein product, partial [Closterium sp. NIES-54]